MARKSRTAVLKRQREAKKAEKAAHKREKRQLREAEPSSGAQIATDDEMAGYGFGSPDDQRDESEEPPRPPPSSSRDRRLRLRPRKETAWPKSPDRGLHRLREPCHRRAPDAQGQVQDRPRGATSAREGAHRLQARLLRLGATTGTRSANSTGTAWRWSTSRRPRPAARTAPTSTWSWMRSISVTRSSTSISSR